MTITVTVSIPPSAGRAIQVSQSATPSDPTTIQPGESKSFTLHDGNSIGGVTLVDLNNPIALRGKPNPKDIPPRRDEKPGARRASNAGAVEAVAEALQRGKGGTTVSKGTKAGKAAAKRQARASRGDALDPAANPKNAPRPGTRADPNRTQQDPNAVAKRSKRTTKKAAKKPARAGKAK